MPVRVPELSVTDVHDPETKVENWVRRRRKRTRSRTVVKQRQAFGRKWEVERVATRVGVDEAQPDLQMYYTPT